jgi:hypothetical protein
LPLQHADLMAQSKDLDVLVAIVHRQQPQERESVAHREIGQAHQYERSSCRSYSLDTRTRHRRGPVLSEQNPHDLHRRHDRHLHTR